MEPRGTARHLPLRLLTALALVAILVVVPVRALAADGAAGLARTAIAAVASGPAGAGEGFVLDRHGTVLRVAADGTTAPVASVGPYRTPFGTNVAGRVVFGGIRCIGRGCPTRVAELTVLDDHGARATGLVVERTDGWPSRLDGVALVGTSPAAGATPGGDVGTTGGGTAGPGVGVGAGGRLWVNAGGVVFEVEVPAGSGEPPRVVAEVPWPGGEPCVVGGVLHDLRVTGEGAGPVRSLRLALGAWDGRAWWPIPGGGTALPAGHNAHCTPDGYEVRDGAGTRARWSPSTLGWTEVDEPAWGTWAPVGSSTHRRYGLGAGGEVVELAPGGPRATGVVLPATATATVGATAAGDGPPALQVDDAGGTLTWCATTYRASGARTRCGVAHPAADTADTGTAPVVAPPPGRGGTVADVEAVDAQHYNLCSSSCGDGARPHTRDVVAWLADRHRPAAVSLNEACYDDVVALAARLPGYRPAAGHVALGSTTNCPGAVKRFGNHLLVHRDLGPTEAWSSPFATQASTPCDTRTQECRGVACAATVDRRPGVVWCTAHLESPRHGASLPARQAAEYLDLVTARYGDRDVRVLAGDFNLERRRADRLLGPAGYRSATGDPTTGSHDPSGGDDQIDMVYDDAGRPDPPGTATWCDPQASDHCHIASFTRG